MIKIFEIIERFCMVSDKVSTYGPSTGELFCLRMKWGQQVSYLDTPQNYVEIGVFLNCTSGFNILASVSSKV